VVFLAANLKMKQIIIQNKIQLFFDVFSIAPADLVTNTDQKTG